MEGFLIGAGNSLQPACAHNGVAYVCLPQCADDVRMCDARTALVRYEKLLTHTATTLRCRFSQLASETHTCSRLVAAAAADTQPASCSGV